MFVRMLFVVVVASVDFEAQGGLGDSASVHRLIDKQ